MRLTLIGRRYCHLCDDMRAAVAVAVAGEDGLGLAPEVVEIDLDEHPLLEDRYTEWVPVLLLGEPETGIEICHYHFDAARWAAITGLSAPFHRMAATRN
ncbi:MAG: glutaredoxin family protein [Aeromicrobium sp.]|nr:glutaredoxin family protein [Burkholderiales bacterium]